MTYLEKYNQVRVECSLVLQPSFPGRKSLFGIDALCVFPGTVSHEVVHCGQEQRTAVKLLFL